MFITIFEILDMILMIAVVGFIFKDAFKIQKKTDDLEGYLKGLLPTGWKK